MDQGDESAPRRHILGQVFIAWLERDGIIPDSTRRVVIDAEFGKVVTMYVEQFGSASLVDVHPPAELRTAVSIVARARNPRPDYPQHRRQHGEHAKEMD